MQEKEHNKIDQSSLSIIGKGKLEKETVIEKIRILLNDSGWKRL